MKTKIYTQMNWDDLDQMECYNYINFRVRCSNKLCSHVFVYRDVIYPIINDTGFAITKCPSCNSLTKVKVWNVQCYQHNPDVVEVFESDDNERIKANECVPLGRRLDEGIVNPNENSASTTTWTPSNIPIWKSDEKDYESMASSKIEKSKEELAKYIDGYKQASLAGQLWMDNVEHLFVKVYDAKNSFSIYYKPVPNPEDFNIETLKYIHHPKVKLSTCIDGIYSRDYCFSVLDHFLNRWKSFSNMVFFVTPFIGFQYKTRRYDSQIKNYWEWINESVDIDKTVFITKKDSFTRIKEILGKNNEDSIAFNKKWGKLNSLLTAVLRDQIDNKEKQKRGRKKKKDLEVSTSPTSKNVIFKQDFHSKFYAGVYRDRVEVLIGSYNISEGKSVENISFKSYSTDDFISRFIEPLVGPVSVKEFRPSHKKCVVVDLKSNKIDSRFDDFDSFVESINLL